MRPTAIIKIDSITINTVAGKKKEDSIPSPNDSNATPNTLQTVLVLFIMRLQLSFFSISIFASVKYDTIFFKNRPQQHRSYLKNIHRPAYCIFDFSLSQPNGGV